MTPPDTAPTMQDAILALQRYWTENGCLITQPVNTEVGAGTANPSTALRVLGPEPWRVAYVEPSVRPDDARYGENPNRLQTHTQFQVILKPDPGNPQELYLGSLQALGVDLAAHDVRFVEDNWASPALGAWGLGWEVWLDGLEITQFTYFQQAGGTTLDPISVEITYGLERILMALQGVSHFKDIRYAPGVSYGEIFSQAEYEMSRFYLDDADTAVQQELFDRYAAEAQRMLDLGLPVPAYLHVLKCSHAFNVLDARGVISTTERATAFGTMRRLTRDATALWMARREELGHPLLGGEGREAGDGPELLDTAVTSAAAGTDGPPTPPAPAGPATLLFEIGVEELPHADVLRTAEAIREAATAKLAATRLAHGEIDVQATPRRVVLTVADVEPREPDAPKVIKGPPVSAAFDADGNPTRPLQGFMRGHGVEVDQIGRTVLGGTEFATIERLEVGRAADEVLAGVLAELVSELRADRNMRWSDPELSFSRPVRWLLALLGDHPVRVEVSALRSGTTTRVHRTAEQPEIPVQDADGYAGLLTAHDIVLERDRRRELVVQGAEELAASVGGHVDLDAEAGLIDEVTDLVELPNALLGAFDPRYLELPAAILTTVMRKHQRYLPVLGADGGLLPYFITVANGRCDEPAVIAGNEAVIRARYEDAAFFWRADLQVAPETFRGRIDKLTFEERLGSMADRAARIARLGQGLAVRGGLATDALETVDRAGALAKFDLASQMVIELSSLAGTMAQEYAARAGETAEVAQALAEMELPRSAGDRLPATAAGAVLSLADRFDLLVGMFAIGAVPTGSSDPFGVRRAAIGIVTVLRAFGSLQAVTLRQGLEAAAAGYAADGIEVDAESLDAAADFIVRRFERQLLDAGHAHTLVQAVMVQADAPAAAEAALAVLEARVDTPELQALAAALGRVGRILPAGTPLPASGELDRLGDPTEVALADRVAELRVALGGAGTGDLALFLREAEGLPALIDAFFDSVMVMDPDPEIRAARLGLLADIADLAAPVLDWSVL